jgi:hypothetical protein
MTPYERAQIRLQAFKLLAGWGTTFPGAEKLEDRFKPWELEKLKSEATVLADWAVSP